VNIGAFSHKFSLAPSGETNDTKKLEGANWARTSSITMPSMVGIVRCALAVDEQVALLSRRDRAMLRVIEYYAKSLKVTQGHSK